MCIRHKMQTYLFIFLYNISSEHFSLRYTFNNHAGDSLRVARRPSFKVYLTVVLESIIKIYINKTENESRFIT
jgi:hypothetical protein